MKDDESSWLSIDLEHRKTPRNLKNRSHAPLPLRFTAPRTTAKSHSSRTTGGPVLEALKSCSIPYWSIWQPLKCRPQLHFPMSIPMAARCCFLSAGDRADEAILRTFHAFPCH